MNISHQTTFNIDSARYKRRKSVSIDELSTNSVTNKTPLERTENRVSFKGVSSILIKNTKPMEYKSAMDSIRRAVGNSTDLLMKHIMDSETMSQRVIIDKANDSIVFKEKQIPYLIVDAMKFPFTDMPFLLLDWALKGLKRGGPFKNAQWIDSIQNKDFYKKLKKTMKDDEKLNALRGNLEVANLYKFDTEQLRKSALVQDAMKMFDPSTGNYNGVHERALTRIVTGFIPAVFLANDAYNLSRLCDDDPKAAANEKSIRFNQEAKRVTSNAYIQLITLGALSKYINNSKFAVVATNFFSILFTEMYSRLSNGRRIHFISPEEARKINAKENNFNAVAVNQEVLPAHQAGDKATLAFKNNLLEQIQQTNKTPQDKHSSLFNEFSLMNNFKTAPVDNKQNVKDSKSSNAELKPLLSLSSIAKASLAVVAAGFAVKGLRNIKLTKVVGGKNVESKPVAEFLDSIKNYWNNKIINPLTVKKHIVKRDEFYQLIEKMCKNGFNDIAQEYENTTLQYQKKLAISRVKNEFVTDLQSVNIDASGFGKIDRAALFTENLNRYIKILNDNNMNEFADFVKNTMFDSNGKLIDIKNSAALNKAYDAVVKKLKSLQGSNLSLNPYKRSLDTSFFVNENSIIVEQFESLISKLKTGGNDELAQKYQKVLDDAVNSPEFLLGETATKYAPLVKFVIQPFKFMFGTINLPNYFIKVITNPFKPHTLPKMNDEMKVISRSYQKLSKKLEQDDAVFAHDFNESIVKSFNKLTMSGVSNAQLSELSKFSGTAATLWFLVADNYNMVMLKSNGENVEEAKLKANERIVQEASRTFYNMLFINLFNDTFSSTYHKNLIGAQLVNAASTLVGEYTNRKAIGMPVVESSRDEILDNEYKNMTSTGIKGKFFRFMSRLTGKKLLSQRDNLVKNKNIEQEPKKLS